MHDLLSGLRALADENRMAIVSLLVKHEMCVGALARALGISEPAVSQHLRILRRTGIVRGEKRGYWTHYSVNGARVVELAELLRSVVGQGGSRDGGDRG